MVITGSILIWNKDCCPLQISNHDMLSFTNNDKNAKIIKNRKDTELANI